MKKKSFSLSDIVIAVFIILLIVPQTRMAIQVTINKVRVLFFSPSELAIEDRIEIQPFDYTVIDLEDQRKVIGIGKDKAVFLSYWATWCPPCIAELPSIQKLYNDYGNRINFVLLTNEDSETVRAFLEKKQYDLPVYRPGMVAPEKLYEHSIPTNYLIDKAGNIVVKETGATNWNGKKVRNVLDALVK